MKRHMFKIGIIAAMLSVSSFFVGCQNKKADEKHTKLNDAKTDPKAKPEREILETVDLEPGKPISPENRAKVSSIGLKILGHVSKAQEDIQAKNVEDAKKELTKAMALVGVLKEVLPTVKIIDHIWVTKTNLSYLNTTEVQEDLVSLLASVDQLYDVLPVGKAKEHAKGAKDVLTKEKVKGAPKAKEELEAVEVALDFREVDLSVSYTARLVKVAQADLDKGKTKEASAALKAAADGVVFFDTAVIDPVNAAARHIWLAKQHYADKDYKTAKTRLGMAKASLNEITQSGNKKLHEGAKYLMGKIETVDGEIMKGEERTVTALESLWHDLRKLVDPTPSKVAIEPGSNEKTTKEAKIATQTFIRAADQTSMAEVKLGKVAEDHAASDSVKKFGVRAVRDHSLMNKELREITTKKGISVAEKLDPKQQELVDELSKLKGSDFDRAYTKDMVSGHEKAIEQFEIEVKSGRDADVKAWAEKWLPTLREHLTQARDAVKNVKAK